MNPNDQSAQKELSGLLIHPGQSVSTPVQAQYDNPNVKGTQVLSFIVSLGVVFFCPILVVFLSDNFEVISKKN